MGVEKGELFEDILMLPDEKQKRQWSPGQEYSKMSGSPAEDFDYSTISEAQSLSPDDIEDILRGKVNHLVRRLHQGQLKAYGEVEEPDENDSVESYDHEAVAKLLNRPVSSITELNEVEDGDNSRANSFEESWANDDTREDISEINSVVEELEKSDFEVPLENSFEESEVLQLAARKKQHQQQVMVVDTSKSGPGNSTDQKKKLPVTKPKVVEVEEELEEVSSVASEPLEDFDAKPIPDAEELRQRRASFLEQFQATQKQKKQMENLKILKKTEEETEEKAAEITRPVPSERRVRFTSHQEQSEEDFELSEESENSVISTQEMIPPIKAKRNSLQRSDTIEIKEISESLRVGYFKIS